MSDIVKLMYRDGSTKMNVYVDAPSSRSDLYYTVGKNISSDVFDFRMYWIDSDGDEIEMKTDNDVDLFNKLRKTCSPIQGYYVSPLNSTAATPATATATAATPTATAATPTAPAAGAENSQNEKFHHLTVSCDLCGVAPIVGFRYKCMECPNFDLCQNCEAQEKHSNHVMMRLPKGIPSFDIFAHAFASRSGSERKRAGFTSRRSKRSKDSPTTFECPFMEEPTGDTSATNEGTPPTTGDRREYRRHCGRWERRQMRNGFFTPFYNMMFDLAEGGSGGTPNEAQPQTAGEGEAAGADNSSAAGNAANAARTPPSEQRNATPADVSAAAVNVAEVAAKFAHQAAQETIAKLGLPVPLQPTYVGAAAATASARSNNGATGSSTPPQQTTDPADGGKSPKTPPPTPDSSVPHSGSAVNLSQLVDPQYLQAGIQILSNFSEMFAKILDPALGAGVGGAPNSSFAPNAADAAASEQRRASTATTTSTSSDSSTPTPQQAATNAQSAQAELPKELGAKPKVKAASSEAAGVEATTNVARDVSVSPEDSEWQLIDDNSDDGANTSSNSNRASSTVVNYAQLGEMLKTHIMQTEERGSYTNDAATATERATTSDVATGTKNAATTDAATGAEKASTSDVASGSERAATIDAATTTGGASGSSTSTPVSETKRAVPVFHRDPKVNSAVQAMMAMGFSNQDSALTQILESVNGNIAEALELMTIDGGNRRT